MLDLPRQSITLPDGSRGFTPKRSATDTIREKAAKRAEREKVKREAESKAKRKAIKPRKRWAFYKANGFRCTYCGGLAGSKGQDGKVVELAIDHRVSLADGGTDDETNWVCSCVACNAGKGRKSA